MVCRARKNYNKGRAKEYRICKKLEKEGFEVAQRSAGSNSPIDVFAINLKTRVIKFVQAKPDKFSEKREKEIMDKWGEINGMFRAEFYVE